jgi:hypothetical protein
MRNHDIAAAQQFEGVDGAESCGVRFDFDFGVDAKSRRARQLQLRLADILERVDRLTVQIAGIQPVGFHQLQGADAGAGQILQNRAAEAAQAYDEHTAALQGCLAGRADFLELPLSGVIRPHQA